MLIELVRRSLSFANVTSVVALFIALGGSAYAVTQIDRNSVKSKHIVDGQVRTNDVEDDGLTGVDVDEASLGSVPLAEQANTANSAQSAGDANTLDSKDSTDFARAGSENWQAAQLRDGSLPHHFPGQFAPRDWCYWSNYENGHTQAAYFRDPAGVVHLKGLVKANNGNFGGTCSGLEPYDVQVVFDLPAGYRPSERWLMPTVSANKPGRLDVLPNGKVQIEVGFPAWGDALQWVSLDGITFRCAPSGENGCP
jgi:hypothetical protein